MSVNPESELIKNYPEQLLNEDGSKHKVTYWTANTSARPLRCVRTLLRHQGYQEWALMA